MKFWVYGLVAAVLGASPVGAGPVPGEPEPFIILPGGFTVTLDEGAAMVSVTGGGKREIARYRLAGCAFDAPGAGVFAITFPGLNERLVAASCHGTEGRRFHLMAPKRDAEAPVFSAMGAGYAVHPDRVEVLADDGAAAGTWSPEVPQDADEIAWATGNAAAAEGRELAPPAPVADPDFLALEARLHKIATARDAEALVAMAAPDVLTSFGGGGTAEELRQLVAEPWFWDELARLLAGGGALVVNSYDESKGAVFPAAFSDWPEDLDAFSYVYGDREGAVLRAGPSINAPALMPVYRQILARGPYLEGDDLLREAGWGYFCRAPVGCGYARDVSVRSSIDYRALLNRPGPGEPWVLEALVAGD